MKRILTILCALVSMSAFSQITPVTPPAGTKLNNNSQFYLYKNLAGDTIRAFARWAAPGIPAAYYEIKDGTGGGGGVSSVTSANADISVANTTTTPVLTLNSGTGADQIVKRGSNAQIPFASSNNFIEAPNASTMIYQAGISTTANHIFRFGANTAMTLNHAALSINNNVPRVVSGTSVKYEIQSLSTALTPPATTGTTKMVVSDANGLLSFDNIPSGTGTVTSFSKTDGFGITSSVTNPTTTPNHTVAVDTTVIASKAYVNSRSSRIIKDFYADSVVSGSTTEKILYGDTLAANTLLNNGDKLIFKVGGTFQTVNSAALNTFRVSLSGVNIAFFNANAVTFGSRPFSLLVTIIKYASNSVKVTSTFTYETQSDSGGAISSSKVYFAENNVFSLTTSTPLLLTGQLDSSTSSEIRAEMGYIEFMPAAL